VFAEILQPVVETGVGRRTRTDAVFVQRKTRVRVQPRFGGREYIFAFFTGNGRKIAPIKIGENVF